MYTIFTIPKPFRGHIGVIQRNAIESWTRLAARPEVIVFGDEEGIADACRELGVTHVPEVARNEWGTPLLDDVFGKAQRLARHDLLCYANCDIILGDDFTLALQRVASQRPRFLLTGQRTDVNLTERLSSAPSWRAELDARVRREGKRYGPWGMDYFAFPRGLWPDIPAFAVGRVCWDNWMIWAAKDRKAWVVDGTFAVRAIHQNHSYAHIAHSDNGKDWAWNGPEAQRNRALAGGWDFVFSLYDADHLLIGGRIVPALTYHHLKRRIPPKIRWLTSTLRWIRRRALPRARLLRLYYSTMGAPDRAREFGAIIEENARRFTAPGRAKRSPR